MTVITLSRQMGSHAEEIAVALAESMGMRLISAETIDEAARKAGVPDMALEELEDEGERGLVDQMLKALRTMPAVPFPAPVGASTTLPEQLAAQEGELSGLAIPFAGLFSPTVPPVSASLHRYLRMVGMVIRGLAQQGTVLIAGRGGQVILRNFPNTLHVLIVAPQQYRVKVLMARFGLDKRTAENRLRASDRARADYLRRYHDVNWLDPNQYHLVINTGWVPISKAIELITCAAQPVPQAGDKETS